MTLHATVLTLCTGVLLAPSPLAQGSYLSAADGDPQKALIVDTTGRIGVGTLSPLWTLHVRGDLAADGGALVSRMESNEGGRISLVNPLKSGDAASVWNIYNMAGRLGNGLQMWSYTALGAASRLALLDDGTTLLAPNGGRVGIGKAPYATLDVAGDIAAYGGELNSSSDDPEGGRVALVNRMKTGNAARVWKIYNMSGAYGDSLQMWNYTDGGAASRLTILDDGTTLLAPNGGRVGVGKTPNATLDVAGEARVGYLTVEPQNSAAGEGGEIVLSGGAEPAWALDVSGDRFRIHTQGQELFGLRPSGMASVKSLEIRGGADLAELFEISGEVNPGMVVCADPEREGALTPSTRAYDTSVIGIVSGAGGVTPGLTLSKEDTLADGHFAVAMVGRVYCWCDAGNGAITPGTLLTTSDTPGHAMNALNKHHARGAIIGKALGTLRSGRGLVLVAVTLQ